MLSVAHGVARQAFRCLAAILLAAALSLAAESAASQPAQHDGELPPPLWPNSPFRGIIDGTGKPIPCRCRAIGGTFQLGDILCMRTHLGVQLARCDLLLNNTSWVPLGIPCTLSRLDSRHTTTQ
jgi:hypothetical protein